MSSGPQEHAQDSDGPADAAGAPTPQSPQSEPGAREPSAAPGAPPGASTEQNPNDSRFEYQALENSDGVELMEGLSLLSDVDLDVTVELGRTEMVVEDVLQLGDGSVVELDKLAGDPVDIYVNDRLIARGEVLVLNENFCVRISEILKPMTVELEDSGVQGSPNDLDSPGQEAA